MNNVQQGFSKFTWALALFCLPSALFPLAWFVSPSFSDNPQLSSIQKDIFSIAFWVYPIVLLACSALLYRLNERNSRLAKALLVLAFVAFYLFVGYIFSYV